MPSSSGNVGGITSDGKTLYVSVADLGTYAIDLNGNVLWRVGARDGGEPAAPVIWATSALLARRATACSSRTARPARRSSTSIRARASPPQPTVTSDGRLYVMCNRGILYAFDLD